MDRFAITSLLRSLNCSHPLRYLSTRVDSYGVDAFDVEIDPLELEFVDPNAIRRFSYRAKAGNTRCIEASIGNVRDGNWDREGCRDPHVPDPLSEALFADRFEETVLFESFRQRYDDGLPWQETGYYEAIVDSISERQWHGCSDRTDVDAWMQGLDALYRSIRDEGYRAYTQLHGCRCKACLANEIAVDIGRDGDILFVAGRHRLAIAKLLGLDEIPVVIVVRHYDSMANEP